MNDAYNIYLQLCIIFFFYYCKWVLFQECSPTCQPAVPTGLKTLLCSKCVCPLFLFSWESAVLRNAFCSSSAIPCDTAWGGRLPRLSPASPPPTVSRLARREDHPRARSSLSFNSLAHHIALPLDSLALIRSVFPYFLPPSRWRKH